MKAQNLMLQPKMQSMQKAIVISHVIVKKSPLILLGIIRELKLQFPGLKRISSPVCRTCLARTLSHHKKGSS